MTTFQKSNIKNKMTHRNTPETAALLKSNSSKKPKIPNKAQMIWITKLLINCSGKYSTLNLVIFVFPTKKDCVNCNNRNPISAQRKIYAMAQRKQTTQLYMH
jgi:hypothetical protein